MKVSGEYGNGLNAVELAKLIREARQAAEAAEAEGTGDAEGQGSGGKGNSGGVLGLLSEGHFKGVAEFVLSLNFLDQSGEESEKDPLSSFFGEQTSSLLAELDSGQADELTSALAEFSETVQAAAKEYAEGEGSDPEAFVQAMENAFEAFAAKTRETFMASADEAGDGGGEESGSETDILAEMLSGGSEESSAAAGGSGGEVDSDGDGIPDWLEEILDNLKTSFEEAVESFTADKAEGEEAAQVQAAGNGRAYGKYLAIYQAMQEVS